MDYSVSTWLLLIFLGRYFYRMVSHVAKLWLCKNFPIDLKKHGSWAVITGGSRGIGAAYARELANRGLNICLISRTESKLREVCNEIRQKFDVEVDYEVCDVSDKNSLFNMKNILERKRWFNEIGILVNNAGILPFAYESFSEVAEDEFQRLFW